MRHHLALAEEGRGSPRAANSATSHSSGGKPFHVDFCISRTTRPGPALCAPGHGGEPAVHRHRGALAGPRHRRQHRHLQLHGRHPDARAAGVASRTTGRCRTGTPSAAQVVQRINGSSRRYGKGGSLSPNFPSAPSRLCGPERTLFSTLFAYTYARQLNRDRRGAGGDRTGGNSSPEIISAAWACRPPPDGCSTTATTAPARRRSLVLSYAYWQSRFHGDPSVIGQLILINNLPFTIVGVAAPGFFGVDPASHSRLLPADSRHAHSGGQARRRRARALPRRSLLLDRNDGPAPSRREHRAGPGRCRRALPRLRRRHRDQTERRRSPARVPSAKPGPASIRCAVNTPSRSTC